MLRAPLRPNPGRKQVSIGKSVPAPVKGLDALSPLSDMEPEYASVMENWIPGPGYIHPRRGYVVHGGVIGGTSPVESLMTWNGPSSSKLFGASGTGVYEFTSGSPSSAEISGLTNARFQHANFSTTGGNFIFIVNGSDGPYHYNGSAWATPSITGSGFSGSDFAHVTVHKSRLWFVIVDSTKGAYLPVDSIAGTATSFEFGRHFTLGGNLQAIGTWTLDSGTGPDDFLVAISSKGQAAIYQGTDPASATTWAIVGVFNLSPPIGRRCFTKVAGDLALISIDGVVPLSQAVRLDRGAVERVTLMTRLSPLINQDARDSADLFGWQLIGYPKSGLAILNVPITEGATSRQYVLNTLTGAPTKFINLDAMCWELYDDRPFFGGADGIVYESDIGSRDVSEAIVSNVKLAFNHFGLRGELKNFTMVRPLIVTDGDITPSLSIDVDFADNPPATPASSVVTSGTKWNQFNWNESNWAGGTVSQVDWSSVSGLGYCAAIRMKVSVVPESAISLWDLSFSWDQSSWDINGQDDIDIRVNGFDIIMERGGMI